MGLVRRRRFDFLDDDIDQFSHGASRLAVFETGNKLGQRSGNVLKMKWLDYDGEWLHVEQGKTRAEVNLPVHLLWPLNPVINIQHKVGPTNFTTPTGKTWNHFNLHRNFNLNRVKAKADGLHWQPCWARSSRLRYEYYGPCDSAVCGVQCQWTGITTPVLEKN